MTPFLKRFLMFCTTGLMLVSCAPRKRIVYLQEIEKAQAYTAQQNYEPLLKPDDLLSIVVSTESMEVAAPFNLPDIKSGDAENRGIKTYLIDNAGYIDFPVLGKVKLGGLTRTDANTKLVAAISEYVKNPIVTMRITNFKISVLGEVRAPGSFVFEGERVTILDAIGRAGDLTIYGRRHNVLVIREENGKKTHARIDLGSPLTLDSPFYYLKQNDVVYVEPNQTRVNNSAVGPDMTIILSSISLAITIAVLLSR